MKSGDKVKLLPDNPLTEYHLPAGSEGVILQQAWVEISEESGEPSDGFWVEFVNPRTLKERWLALPSELEIIA